VLPMVFKGSLLSNSLVSISQSPQTIQAKGMMPVLSAMVLKRLDQKLERDNQGREEHLQARHQVVLEARKKIQAVNQAALLQIKM
jgi:hypothetical protein